MKMNANKTIENIEDTIDKLMLANSDSQKEVNTISLFLSLSLSLSLTHTHTYIYINIYISSSSYRTGSTDIPDPLSPLLPIVHPPR